MTICYGAMHDLEKIIDTHLFIICANNSGTTFLRDALATSHRTWNLLREGQHMFGFAGPSSIGLRAHKRWASEPQWINIFTNPANYDWETIRRSWYFQAFSQSANATVFVEKSPPFLLIVEQLVKHFKKARFLFMVRDPYAVIEGARRTTPSAQHNLVSPEEVLNLTATHVINCLKFQQKNIEKWGDRGVFFTYEQMCAEPQKITQMIKELVPQVDDLVLQQRLAIKEYDEELRNMNDQQIKRLTVADKQQINELFSRNQELLNYFGYAMRD